MPPQRGARSAPRRPVQKKRGNGAEQRKLAEQYGNLPRCERRHRLKSDRCGEDTGEILHPCGQHGGREHDARQHDGRQKNNHGDHRLFRLRSDRQSYDTPDCKSRAEQHGERTKIQRQIVRQLRSERKRRDRKDDQTDDHRMYE